MDSIGEWDARSVDYGLYMRLYRDCRLGFTVKLNRYMHIPIIYV